MASRRAVKFWEKLTQWYGVRLSESYGASVPAEWAELIDRTSDERMRLALQAIRRDHVKFPPTLGEFESAIPGKNLVGGPSMVQQLSEFAVVNRGLCMHQVRGPWSYFGPEEEFPSKGRGGEMIKHARVEGVVIPACGPCAREGLRVRSDAADFIEFRRATA
jgi:hypothetical protein